MRPNKGSGDKCFVREYHIIEVPYVARREEKRATILVAPVGSAAIATFPSPKENSRQT